MFSDKAKLAAQIPAAIEEALVIEAVRSEMESEVEITYAIDDFDREEIDATLGAELHAALEELNDWQLSGIIDSEGNLILRGLFNYIERPSYQNIHYYFWAAYCGTSKAVEGYLDVHMGGDLTTWVKNLLSNPQDESNRVSALGGAAWDLDLITKGIKEGLNEFLNAGELDIDADPVELLGNGDNFDDLKVWIIDHQRKATAEAKWVRFTARKEEFALANA